MGEEIETDGKEYIFNRNFKSSMRLNYNHWIMRRLCGYLLHPTIINREENSNTTDLYRVADIGTGTGIWPLELATESPFPSSRLRIDGFDISLDQFPPREWCPPNVRLQTHDAFGSFPPECRGVYDVVHVRFFLCLVNDEDADPLLDNLCTLLKPGGYLQWMEPDHYGSRVKCSDPSATTTPAAAEELLRKMRKPSPKSTYNWVQRLASSFEKHGLDVVADDRIELKDIYRLMWGQSILAGVEDLAADASVIGDQEAENARVWIDRLRAEFAQGVYLDTSWVCALGRKLSSASEAENPNPSQLQQ